MPRCPTCGELAKKVDLAEVNGKLACKSCRRPKAIKEMNMAENRKKLLSFHIFEVPTKDGAKDHEVEVEGTWGGLDLKYTTTFDKIREFFTQKREEGKPATLRSVN